MCVCVFPGPVCRDLPLRVEAASELSQRAAATAGFYLGQNPGCGQCKLYKTFTHLKNHAAPTLFKPRLSSSQVKVFEFCLLFIIADRRDELSVKQPLVVSTAEFNLCKS